MKNKEFAIIIPSYKETENIVILIKKIGRNLPGSKIIIIDDSPLNENEKLKITLKGYKNITIISRFKKSGRGSAVILGFKEALKDTGVEYLFEMDSDLAHNPEEMGRFLRKMNDERYDLIIGSRYLTGGKVINMPKNRIILSRIINKFLRIWLGVKISDYTGGFRLYNRNAVEFLIGSKLDSTGFITLSEIVYKLNRKKFKIGEVPITVQNRKQGKSSVNLMEFVNSLTFVIKMKFKYGI